MRRTLATKTIGWAMLVVVLGATAGAVRAAAAPPAPPSVSITVLGIRATAEATPYVDPVLAPIANELKARSSKYNCFRKVVTEVKSVPVGGVADVSMIENYALRVQVEKTIGNNVQLVISWLRLDKPGQPLQSVRLTIVKGKYLLSGGWDLKDGALWGAVAAQ